MSRTVYMGVDPALKGVGIAWFDPSATSLPGGGWHVGRVPGLEHLGGYGPLLALASDRGVRIVCAIERARAYFPGQRVRFTAAAAASTRAEAFLRSLFARRNVIQRVDPPTWQRAIFGESIPRGGRGEEAAKQQTEFYYLRVLRLPVPDEIPPSVRHDAYDAAALAEYARAVLSRRT